MRMHLAQFVLLLKTFCQCDWIAKAKQHSTRSVHQHVCQNSQWKTDTPFRTTYQLLRWKHEEMKYEGCQLCTYTVIPKKVCASLNTFLGKCQRLFISIISSQLHEARHYNFCFRYLCSHFLWFWGLRCCEPSTLTWKQILPQRAQCLRVYVSLTWMLFNKKCRKVAMYSLRT